LDNKTLKLVAKLKLEASAIGLNVSRLPSDQPTPPAVEKAEAALEGCLNLLTRVRKELDGREGKDERPRLAVVGCQEDSEAVRIDMTDSM
jgi:hypothetical protein